jgi:hypothetical protein
VDTSRRSAPALNRARAEASAAVCAVVAKPGRRISLCLRDLAAEGVSMTTLQQVRITESDDGCDPLAVIGRALNRAAERGYHDPNAVPPEWLAR